MISPEQKKEITKYLPFRYARLVQKRATEKGLLNRKNKPYSIYQISNTMNGVENLIIEDVIYELVAEAKATIKKRELILKQE